MISYKEFIGEVNLTKNNIPILSKRAGRANKKRPKWTSDSMHNLTHDPKGSHVYGELQDDHPTEVHVTGRELPSLKKGQRGFLTSHGKEYSYVSFPPDTHPGWNIPLGINRRIKTSNFKRIGRANRDQFANLSNED
jgi:hypothetical protein